MARGSVRLRGLLRVVHGDDRVHGAREEVPSLGLVELQAVDAPAPSVRDGLVAAERRGVALPPRHGRAEREGTSRAALPGPQLARGGLPAGRPHGAPALERGGGRQSYDDPRNMPPSKHARSQSRSMETTATRRRASATRRRACGRPWPPPRGHTASRRRRWPPSASRTVVSSPRASPQRPPPPRDQTRTRRRRIRSPTMSSRARPSR